ncbi:MAG: hypothetical protein WC959_08875 [Kiritimatiellales bacterium]
MKREKSVIMAVILTALGLHAQDAGDYRLINTTPNAPLSVLTNWEMYDGTGWIAATAIPGSNAVIRSPEGSSHANLRINVDDWTIGGINVDLASSWRFQGHGGARTMTVTGDLIKAGNAALIFYNGDSSGLTVNILGNLDLQEHFLQPGTALGALDGFSVAGHTTIAGSFRSHGNTVLNTVQLNDGSMTVWESNNDGTSGGVTAAGVSGTGSIQSKSNATGINQATVNHGSLLINGASGSFDFSGTLQDGMHVDGASTFSLVKEGGSTQTFSGTGTYSGTTEVKGGALLINGDFSAVTNTFTVSAGAMLGGTGAIGAMVEFADGALLSLTSTLTADANFAGFDMGDIYGLDEDTALGTYMLLTGAITGTVNNLGEANAADIGNGKDAYLELTGTGLSLVVIPEAATIGLFIFTGSITLFLRKKISL